LQVEFKRVPLGALTDRFEVSKNVAALLTWPASRLKSVSLAVILQALEPISRGVMP
jgi:hypothetical protein